MSTVKDTHTAKLPQSVSWVIRTCSWHPIPLIKSQHLHDKYFAIIAQNKYSVFSCDYPRLTGNSVKGFHSWQILKYSAHFPVLWVQEGVWRDGDSVVKRTCSSCSRPVFSSQYPPGSSQPSNSRGTMPSSGLHGHKARRWYVYNHASKTLAHTKKLKSNK